MSTAEGPSKVRNKLHHPGRPDVIAVVALRCLPGLLQTMFKVQEDDSELPHHPLIHTETAANVGCHRSTNMMA